MSVRCGLEGEDTIFIVTVQNVYYIIRVFKLQTGTVKLFDKSSCFVSCIKMISTQKESFDDRMAMYSGNYKQKSCSICFF